MLGIHAGLVELIRRREDDHPKGAETETVVEDTIALGGYPEANVRDALDRLESEGYIYSADGGEHYRVTDPE